MDPNASNSRNQPLPIQNQSESGQGSEMGPWTSLVPNSPGIVRRILIIQNNKDIITELAAVSMTQRHPIHILAGSGYITRATLRLPPYLGHFTSHGRQEIYSVSGCFQPSFHPHRSLLVKLSGSPQTLYTATTLIADGDVFLDVIFVCGLRGYVKLGGPYGPLRVQHYNSLNLIRR